MTKSYHPYHMVEMSPWPLCSGICAMSITSSVVYWFKFKEVNNFLLSMCFMCFIAFLWWRDVSREATFQGFHNWVVQKGLKWGMILFIFSEVLFFSSFFWTFFHSSLVPMNEIGLIWPPFGIFPLNPFQVPLLNTAILLSSGVTVTWSHHALLQNSKSSIISLATTIILGAYFSFLQWWEYNDASFSMSDSVYGSTFYMATGFHGIHVLIGSLFLFFCLYRMVILHFSQIHHLGYEMAIWYWHFVDVVWLFLFSMMYWWSY